jgi:hypothetical protein
MKLEIFSSLSTGIFAATGSWLLANGSSFSILVMALIGAMIAVLDLEDWTMKQGASLVVFNTLVGTFGGPVLMIYVGMPLEDLPPAALLLVPFLLGWAGHSVITELRGAVMALLAKRVGGAGK